MKKKFIKPLIISVVVGAVLIGGGVIGYKYYVSKKTTTVATSRQITATAQLTNMQVKITGTGSVYAGTSKNITANNSGTLQNLNLKVGQMINAGDSLFTVDSDTLRQNVTTAQNNLKKQQLTLAEAKTDNEIAIDNIAVSNAQTQLDAANEAVNKMAVSSPIGGIITTVNNVNGDTLQSGATVATVVDPASMKIKVSVSELDITKVKVGQSAEITFDALDGKTYQGVVDTVAEAGTTTNNATSYEVVVSVSNPTDVKIGMNANVSIMVESKDNALAIPKEALTEQNGKKYVTVSNSSSTDNSAGTTNNSNTQNSGQTTSSNSSSQGKQSSGQTSSGSSTSQSSGSTSGHAAGGSSGGKLVEVTTGIENDDYVEILSGIQEGQQVLITLPSTSSTTTSSSNKSAFSMGGLTGAGAGTKGTGGAGH